MVRKVSSEFIHVSAKIVVVRDVLVFGITKWWAIPTT
jgi:hypothetical protein